MNKYTSHPAIKEYTFFCLKSFLLNYSIHSE
jgi:hypothetical protein